MSQHICTAIRKLSVRRYRSLREVDLHDLPEIIVLFGPNGSGKSNILRAAQLVLRAAGRRSLLPTTHADAISLTLGEADRELNLRPDDFRYKDLPEIRISIEVDLGTRAMEVLLPPTGQGPSRLELEVVFQLVDNRSIRYWFDRAVCDEHLQLGEPADPNERLTMDHAAKLRSELNQHQANLHAQQEKAAKLTKTKREAGQLASSHQSQLASAEAVIRDLTQHIRRTQDSLRAAEASFSERWLLVERTQNLLIPSLLQASDAYRVPGGPKDPQIELYHAFLSEDPSEREATRRLSERLSKAGLFDSPTVDVTLSPVDSKTYGEKQVHLRHPLHGELPMRNLGSGEQQIVWMLAQRVITPRPIVHLEEPEAHLHMKLMEPLARLLRESVLGTSGTPDVDQLWMATHHHYFAIANEFFDVSLDERGQTTVKRRRRDEAAAHFYEPSPYWDTLRELVETGMSPDKTFSINAQGEKISAQDILDSLDGDRRLADKFVKSATKAFVLSLAEDDTE